MSLTVPQSALDAIHTHCRSAYPHECCGALVGRVQENGKTVSNALPLDNAEPDSPERRFVIDGRQLLGVERKAAADGMAVIGFYHSHPDSSAKPSMTDLEFAWPVYSYIIVSVASGEVAETRSFALDDESADKRFTEENIEIIP